MTGNKDTKEDYTFKTSHFLQPLDVSRRHLHPGEVGWRFLETEGRIEHWVHMVDSRHLIIFSIAIREEVGGDTTLSSARNSTRNHVATLRTRLAT